MKLQTKLTLFITLSKMAVATLFILLLPWLVESIAFKYNDSYLKEQKKKVLRVIAKDGIDTYLQGEQTYGSYTMLKEEYISLEPASRFFLRDTISTVKRIVEGDTLTYRVLSHVLQDHGRAFMLEVGKKTATISQYNRPLQRVALYVLGGLIVITIVTDLIFTRFLLKPLGAIIRARLLNRTIPFRKHMPPVNTSTADFRYLDNSLMELMDQINEAFEKEREFTSNASHELMTPVSILQSKMENLMVDNDLTPAMQRKVMGMMTTLNRLKKIVHSLLLISRIENDQFPRNDELKPSLLIGEVTEELTHRMEEKALQLRITLSRDVILRKMNYDLMFQLLHNLINNAIKFNQPGGEVIIRDETFPGEYHLLIEDTGPGIDEQDMENIFHRFRKGTRNKQEGYGLGLAIVATIAQFHGVKIKVLRRAPRGSTFTLVFPV
ncbi:HAMP domain-containing sensor histidine kinase [Chitinophaga sp. 212800010-3]|uniref:sensor histidine kinase n=1 Tax=unclassified Chitinophaga TaxID=2619133 RepID=UPI002DE837CF|nr:Alkaline phosphatase synthesis sensor protein PhoR [Chitinophaga sp. 212800010-3]